MKSKVISFVTQKGGSGKTTLLMLTAAAVHRRTNKKLLVIDCDPQRSVKQIFHQENSAESYDVFAFNWNQVKPEINFEKTLFLAKRKYDLIFIDVPGSIKGFELNQCVLASDILIVPIVASRLDINATVSFLETVPEICETRTTPLEVYGVINKQDHTAEYKDLKRLGGIGGMQLFYSPISHRVRYRRHISTVNDITDPNLDDDEFNRYFDEFRTKCFV